MKFISMVLAIVFVGLVAYWVFQASLPLPAPEVTYSSLTPYGVQTEIFVPRPCADFFRVFRSDNEGTSWDRVIPPVYRAEGERCVFPDTFADLSRGASRLLYRYALVDARRDVSHWSNVVSVPLSRVSPK